MIRLVVLSIFVLPLALSCGIQKKIQDCTAAFQENPPTDMEACMKTCEEQGCGTIIKSCDAICKEAVQVVEDAQEGTEEGAGSEDELLEDISTTTETNE